MVKSWREGSAEPGITQCFVSRHQQLEELAAVKTKPACLLRADIQQRNRPHGDTGESPDKKQFPRPLGYEVGLWPNHSLS